MNIVIQIGNHPTTGLKRKVLVGGFHWNIEANEVRIYTRVSLYDLTGQEINDSTIKPYNVEILITGSEYNKFVEAFSSSSVLTNIIENIITTADEVQHKFDK